MCPEITKVGEKFEARLFDRDGKETWRTAEPMDKAALGNALQAKGCHPTDIHDAFFQAE